MTTLRKVLPFTLLALVAVWTFTSHHSPIRPPIAYAAQTPDCSFTFKFTGVATQTAISNLSGNTPCVNWRLTLSTTGSLSATVTFYTSPDASTWTAVPNTVCSPTVQPPCILQGANPIVGTQGMLYAASYGSYVQVVVTSPSGSGTGTVRGYGAKGASANASVPSSGGGGGGTASYTISSLAISASPVTVTHNLGTTTPVVALYDHTTGQLVVATVIVTGSNTITITGAGGETVDGIVSTGGIGAAGPTGPSGAATAGSSTNGQVLVNSAGAVAGVTTVPVANGGTGTASTLAGLLRGSASAMTAAELSGDCTTSGSNALTCTKLNNGSFAGTSGHLVSFGAANVPADSGVVAANVALDIASGTATLGTGAISANACASAVTVTATGVAATDRISYTPNADISGVTGYGVASTDGLIIYPYPTTDHVNFRICNATGTSITPGAVTLNWSVVR
jgi:hypothetical protein